MIKALLGGIPVVKDGESARAILAGQPSGARAVTLSGELYCANGPVLVGKGSRSSIISRSHQIQDLAHQVEKSTSGLQKYEGLLEKAVAEAETIRKEGVRLAEVLTNAGKALKVSAG